MAKISALTDTFDVADAAKWSGYGGSVTVSGGLLSIAANFTGLATVTADWDATGSSIFVEVVNGGWLQLTNGADDRAMVFADVNDTSLFLQTYQAGVFAGSDDIAYSTTTHRWWRLRMDAAATNVFLDTAPDGATWTQRLTLGITPTGNYATTTLVSLRSGGSNPVTMDNVNTPPGGGGGGGAVPVVVRAPQAAAIHAGVW